MTSLVVEIQPLTRDGIEVGQDIVWLDCLHAVLLDTDPDNGSLIGAEYQCETNHDGPGTLRHD